MPTKLRIFFCILGAATGFALGGCSQKELKEVIYKAPPSSGGTSEEDDASLLTRVVRREGDGKGNGLTDGDGKGNGARGAGGIDVVTADGNRIPIEDFFEDRKDGVGHACDFADPQHITARGAIAPDPRAWKVAMNDTIKELYRLLPAAGEMLIHALDETEFYLLKLEQGEKLVYTADDGDLLGTTKENCAVRVPNSKDVYILQSCWQNYWENREPTAPYRRMLARLVHEVLLPHYIGRDTYKLGKMVVEILRLPGFYDRNKGHPKSRLLGKQSMEAAAILTRHGIKPTGVPLVTEDYQIDLNTSPRFTFYNWDSLVAAQLPQFDVKPPGLFEEMRHRLVVPPTYCR